MTYVLIEAGRVVRPADADEAAQWEWDRLLDHKARGQYLCRYSNYMGECPRTERECCQGGRLMVRAGWRRYDVRRVAS